MRKLYPMHEAVKILGVSLKTLQRWDNDGKIKAIRTPGGRRRIPESEIKRLLGEEEITTSSRVLAIYARVSSHEQKKKGDLDRQVEQITKHFDQRLFEDIIVITDVSTGLNDNRKGLLKLMKLAQPGKVTDIAISYKDRLTRFGFNYLKIYFESYNVKIHIVNQQEKEKIVYEELVEDLISIVASFSGKLYGIRSRKKQAVVQKISEVIKDASHLPNAD